MAINNNDRSVSIPCIECGRMLKFRIENSIVVDGEGKIAINIPAAVCEDCLGSLLNRVADPPGLVCFEGLSPILVREILKSFTFLLPKSEAAKFFAVLFPEIGSGEA
jgi:hypothetical protein